MTYESLTCDEPTTSELTGPCHAHDYFTCNTARILETMYRGITRYDDG